MPYFTRLPSTGSTKFSLLFFFNIHVSIYTFLSILYNPPDFGVVRVVGFLVVVVSVVAVGVFGVLASQPDSLPRPKRKSE